MLQELAELRRKSEKIFFEMNVPEFEARMEQRTRSK
jgi:hypothetical protein